VKGVGWKLRLGFRVNRRTKKKKASDHKTILTEIKVHGGNNENFLPRRYWGGERGGGSETCFNAEE